MNIDILGISKLKWMGMGEFNSDKYCGQDSQRRNGVALIINNNKNKSEIQYLVATSKLTERSCFIFKASHSIQYDAKNWDNSE